MKGPIGAAANAQITLSVENPATSAVTIPLGSRTVSVNSTEDGAALNFTLYKVENGNVDTPNSTGDISLEGTEADNSGTNRSVYTNLVLLEGALISVSGQFNSTDSIKFVKLTYFPVIENSVSVYIEGGTNAGAYRRVDNLFSASGANDKVFQVVYDDDYRATVLFGDGILGAVPSVNSTYYITYRVGGGSRGNIANEFINATLSNITVGIENNPSVEGTATVENISQGTGGADAETVEHAKKYAPLTFKRQDRLVTLEDYKTFASTYVGPAGSTAKATAVTRKAFSSANIIDVYMVEKANDLQMKRATPTFKLAFLNAIEDKKMLTDEVVVVDGLIRTLDLDITIRVDSQFRGSEEVIKLKVRDKILEFFHADNMDFGKTLILADLNRAIFSIAEVRFSTVDNLDKDVVLDFNEIAQLNNVTIKVAYV